jgi:hypothetical protein
VNLPIAEPGGLAAARLFIVWRMIRAGVRTPGCSIAEFSVCTRTGKSLFSGPSAPSIFDWPGRNPSIFFYHLKRILLHFAAS